MKYFGTLKFICRFWNISGTLNLAPSDSAGPPDYEYIQFNWIKFYFVFLNEFQSWNFVTFVKYFGTLESICRSWKSPGTLKLSPSDSANPSDHNSINFNWIKINLVFFKKCQSWRFERIRRSAQFVTKRSKFQVPLLTSCGMQPAG